MSRRSTFEQEAEVLGLTRKIPLGWTEVIEKEYIKCSFMSKWPPDPSPDSSDSEGAHQELRPSTFNPSFENVLYTAGYVTTFLRDELGENNNETSFATLGGIAVKCHGVDRPFTNDVDIAYEGPIRTLWGVLLRNQRCAMPKTRFVGQAFTMYVKVGPSEGDPLAQDNLIKVQFLVNGFGSMGFANEAVMLQLDTGQLQVEVQCLNVAFLIRSKLLAYSTSFRPKDWHDIKALLLRVSDPATIGSEKIDKAIWTEFLESPPTDSTPTPQLIKLIEDLK